MDLHKFTTQEVLEKISRHCPDAMSTYIQCLNRADNKGYFWFSKEFVESDMSYSWTKFRNQIKKLALEGILEWHPFNKGIAVTLTPLE